MADDTLEEFFAELAAAAGTPALATAEADDVLDLARVVAHGSERRFAPVAAYAAGLAVGAGADRADPAARAARVRAVRNAVRRLVADGGSPAAAGGGAEPGSAVAGS